MSGFSLVQPPILNNPVLTNPGGLERWRIAYSRRMQTPATIHGMGDSTMWGVGSDGTSSGPAANDVADSAGWMGQLRSMFAAESAIAEGGLITPLLRSGQTDTRVTLAGSPSALFTTGIQGFGVQLTNAPKSATITTPICTTIQLLIYQNDGTNSTPTTGSFTYNIDAAGAVSVANTTQGYRVVTITGLAATTHSIVIIGTSASPSYLCGVGYHSGKGVIVRKFGVPGQTAPDLVGMNTISGSNYDISSVGNANALSRRIAAFGAWGSNLNIIMTGYNDAAVQATAGYSPTVGLTPAVYASTLQPLIDAQAAAGGCTLLVSQQLALNGSGALQTASPSDYLAYHDAMRGLAVPGTHCAHIDISDVWGKTLTGVSNAVTYGLNVTNASVHAGLAGHSDTASMVFKTLRRADLYRAL